MNSFLDLRELSMHADHVRSSSLEEFKEKLLAEVLELPHQ
jgi:hypothetical protein